MVDQSRIDQFKQTAGSVSRYSLELSRAIRKAVDPTTTTTLEAMARHVDKPWGYELIWSETPFYTGKKIHVNAGKRLSLQYHNTKRESVFVLSGTLLLHLGEGSNARVLTLQEGESYDIPALELHRFEAPTGGDVDIIEVATPEVDDVVRIEDDYDREGTSAP